jgi:hypothetical protein
VTFWRRTAAGRLGAGRRELSRCTGSPAVRTPSRGPSSSRPTWPARLDRYWICRVGCVTSLPYLVRAPTLRGGEVAVAPLLVMLAIASALVARACSPYVAGTWRSAERVKHGGRLLRWELPCRSRWSSGNPDSRRPTQMPLVSILLGGRDLRLWLVWRRCLTLSESRSCAEMSAGGFTRAR